MSKQMDDADIQLLSNSSPFFRNLFYQKRVLYLYKAVMEILPVNLNTNLKGVVNEETAKQIAKAFRLSRVMCKKWKNTIDDMISTRSSLGPKYVVLYDYLTQNRYTFRDWYETQPFVNFLDKFKKSTTSANPFLGRHIYIDQSIHAIHCAFMTDRFSNQLCQILESFGQCIWSCHISLSFHESNQLFADERLLEWVVRMPHLKNLKIECSIKDDDFDVNRIPPVRRNRRNPVLHLEMLQNVQFLDVPGPFVHIILHNNRHIKSLDIRRSQYERDNADYLNDLPNLQNLEQLSTSVHTDNDLRMLENCEKLRLKKLCVEYRQYQFYKNKLNFDWSEHFEIWNKFSKTLQDLELTYSNSVDGMKWKGEKKFMPISLNSRLNLPKVTRFEIKTPIKSGVDFILGMKDSIETLIIRFDIKWVVVKKERELQKITEKEQIIQLLGHEDNLMESNIWSMLSKLNKVLLVDVGNRVNKLYERSKDVRDVRNQVNNIY